jgi:hypothetical protein
MKNKLLTLWRSVTLKDLLVILIILLAGFSIAELVYGLIGLWSVILRMGIVVFIVVLVIKMKG